MSATAQLRLAAATEVRAPIAPEGQIINVTIESDEKLLLTVVEAAHRLGIGRTLMYELLGSGQIRSVHVGCLRKVPAEALANFVERCRSEARSGLRADSGVTPRRGWVLDTVVVGNQRGRLAAPPVAVLNRLRLGLDAIADART